MTKKTNLIPKRRFREFQNTHAWEQRQLDELANYRRGSFPQPYGNKEWYDERNGMPFVQVVDVGKNLKLVDNTKQKISKLAQPYSVFVEKGKILITLQGSIGRVAITQYHSYVDRTLLIFDSYKRPINEYYFAYSIQQLFEKEKLKAPGGTIKTITKEALSKFLIFIPNIEEQIKIAEFFKQLDDTIALYQRKLEKTKALKSAYLSELFPAEGECEPKRRFAGFTQAWNQCRIGDIFKVTRGQVLAATKTSESKSNDMPYPVYSSQTKNNGLMGYYKDYLFDTAITWTTDGANAGTVNHREGKFYSTNVNGVLLSDEGYANKAVAEALNLVAWKYVSKVGNPKLMNNVMSDIVISLPSNIEEQKKISEFLESIDHLLSFHERKLQKLQNLKKAYLNEMFI